MNAMARAAAAGGVATLFMSAVMVGAQRLGLMGRMPPEKITARVLDRAGIRRDPKQQDMLASAAHIGFGAAAGGLFGTLRPLVGRLPGPLAGAGFGAAVWLVSYRGWVPALGIMPSPAHDRRGRPASMLVAHLIYGAVLGVLAG